MAPTKNIADFLFRHTTFPPITRKQAKVLQRLAELDGLAEAEGWSVGDLYPQEELPEGVLVHVARCLCQLARDRNGLTEEEAIAISLWIAGKWTSVIQRSQKAES